MDPSYLAARTQQVANLSLGLVNAISPGEHRVALRVETRTDWDPILGEGPAGEPDPTSSADTALTGVRVEQVSMEVVAEGAGAVKEGDLLVSGIPKGPYDTLITQAADGSAVVVWVVSNGPLAGQYMLVGGTLRIRLSCYSAVVSRRAGA